MIFFVILEESYIYRIINGNFQLIQMQPYAIRRNRGYSLQVKFFFATLFTTFVVVGYKNFLGPYLKNRKMLKGKAFEQEYFDKLSKTH